MSLTPRALILSASGTLKDAGVPDPVYDASVLLSYLTGDSPLHLRLDTDTDLSDEIVSSYSSLIRERAQRIPLQWLTGTQSFCGRDFTVTPDVLIPRPETALLVERVLSLGKDRPGFAVHDLCCGSGCIAISCKLGLPKALVSASDLSEAALSVAKKNAQRLNAEVCFLHGDLFEPLGNAKADVIVSNPPYIPTGVCSSLQDEVRKEPWMALDGGQDGLDFYRRIIAEAGSHLKPGGALILEIGIDEADAVTSLLLRNGFTGIAVENDLAGIPRMVEGHWHE